MVATSSASSASATETDSMTARGFGSLPDEHQLTGRGERLDLDRVAGERAPTLALVDEGDAGLLGAAEVLEGVEHARRARRGLAVLDQLDLGERFPQEVHARHVLHGRRDLPGTDAPGRDDRVQPFGKGARVVQALHVELRDPEVRDGLRRIGRVAVDLHGEVDAGAGQVVPAGVDEEAVDQLRQLAGHVLDDAPERCDAHAVDPLLGLAVTGVVEGDVGVGVEVRQRGITLRGGEPARDVRGLNQDAVHLAATDRILYDALADGVLPDRSRVGEVGAHEGVAEG